MLASQAHAVPNEPSRFRQLRPKHVHTHGALLSSIERERTQDGGVDLHRLERIALGLLRKVLHISGVNRS